MHHVFGLSRYLYRLRFGPLGLLVAMAAGCGSAVVATPAPTVVSGTVSSATGAPVAGARVTAKSGVIQGTTDSAGHYSLSLPGSALEGPGALEVQADSYAPISRQLTLASRVQDFVLRPYDAQVAIVLPTGTGPNATAAVTRGEGQVTLTIPPDSMVTATGAAASGNAVVRLTYWNPAQDLQNAPGSLAAQLGSNGNVTLALQSLGMVDVQVVQGNDLLQVAPGKNLQLDQKLPAAFQQALAQRPTGVHDPFLFYLDPNSGLWVLDGNLTYDATSGVLHGTLPHLTLWNYDLFENWSPPASCTTDDVLNGRGACAKPENSDLGGCVAGRALQKDGSVLVNQTVRLWLFDFEHISAIDVVTDAQGHYCANVGIRLCVPYAENPTCSYTENSLMYHLSSPASPGLSSLPNPIPQSCAVQSGAYSYAAYNTVQYFNDCGLVNDDSTSQTGNTPAASQPPTASITACSYCSGTGPGYCNVSGAQLSNSCAQLPDITLVPGTDTGAACAQLLKVGDACNIKNAPCCPANTVCSDRVCVPALSGSASK